jgi:hypothetical protein
VTEGDGSGEAETEEPSGEDGTDAD